MTVALLLRVLFWLWFGAAVAAGHFLVLQRLPAFGMPLIIAGLTTLLLLAYFRLPPIRTWVDALDLRTLILVHLTRFVGVYFLILFQRGELPRAFALPAGIGDLIVATMALPVAFAPLEAAPRRRAIAIWNIAGLVDILLVVATAARLNAADPAQLRIMAHLPLSLLPTFLVPLIIVTHVIIYVRTSPGSTPA
jgi:hypothetical protein